MRTKGSVILVSGLVAVLAIGMLSARDHPAGQQPAADNPGREADRAAIRQSARAFTEAFNKGDARAVAALWTEQGECLDESGELLRGRAEIEKAYAELFKEKPGCRAEIDIQSIHFPSRDTAVELGTLRLKLPGAELPISSRYNALHVREDGRWQTAIVREWGAFDDKLDDLAWLIGTWAASNKGREVLMSFEWNDKKTLIRNRFTVKEGGRVVDSGVQTIALDPQTGQLRSWAFDEEGGRGEAVWFRDGNKWVSESVGVLPDGSETRAVNLITRLSDDAFIWRSVNRVVGDSEVPDTAPVKVSRVKTAPRPSE